MERTPKRTTSSSFAPQRATPPAPSALQVLRPELARLYTGEKVALAAVALLGHAMYDKPLPAEFESLPGKLSPAAKKAVEALRPVRKHLEVPGLPAKHYLAFTNTWGPQRKLSERMPVAVAALVPPATQQRDRKGTESAGPEVATEARQAPETAVPPSEISPARDAHEQHSEGVKES
ncbi:hypothetical protein [Ramlibacter rhizophilus]|uniref:Uncharacterized protein n=1 Tax=Ramlibacter rhizophilus TaxID=1781167 RepID=A0A4Z0C087_9BURK|nr:hypothetical protein [Ramlibacter rhizophilus]TFZ04224.1 hypothetical protein EZ242_00210 [Ramlibacter rhizophilus]